MAELVFAVTVGYVAVLTGALLTGAACVMLLLATHDLHGGEDEQDRRIRRKIEAARRRNRGA